MTAFVSEVALFVSVLDHGQSRQQQLCRTVRDLLHLAPARALSPSFGRAGSDSCTILRSCIGQKVRAAALRSATGSFGKSHQTNKPFYVVAFAGLRSYAWIEHKSSLRDPI